MKNCIKWYMLLFVMVLEIRKEALAGIYLGVRLEVVIVEKTLYTKLDDTRVCLGKTEQVFPVHKFPQNQIFTNINYNEDYGHTNIPQILEYK